MLTGQNKGLSLAAQEALTSLAKEDFDLRVREAAEKWLATLAAPGVAELAAAKPSSPAPIHALRSEQTRPEAQQVQDRAGTAEKKVSRERVSLEEQQAARKTVEEAREYARIEGENTEAARQAREQAKQEQLARAKAEAERAEAEKAEQLRLAQAKPRPAETAPSHVEQSEDRELANLMGVGGRKTDWARVLIFVGASLVYESVSVFLQVHRHGWYGWSYETHWLGATSGDFAQSGLTFWTLSMFWSLVL